MRKPQFLIRNIGGYQLLALFAFGALVGCAFGSDNSANQQQQSDSGQRQVIASTYDSITGVYKGTIVSSQQLVLHTSIYISYHDAIVGKDSQGQPRYLPVLDVRMNREEALSLDVDFDANYDAESGHLILTERAPTNPPASSAATMPNDAFSIDAYLIKGSYSGEILTNGINYGVLNISKTSDPLPTEADDNDTQIQRIRAKLGLLAGTYNAKVDQIQVVDPTYNIAPFSPDFRLYIDNSGSIPQLTLYWLKDDAFVPVSIPVTFHNLTTPEEILFRSQDGSDGSGGAPKERFSFTGTYDPLTKTITGALDYPTFSGRLRAVLK